MMQPDASAHPANDTRPSTRLSSAILDVPNEATCPSVAITTELPAERAPSQGCTLSFDANGRILEIDPACARLFGSKPALLRGEDINRYLDDHIVQTLDITRASRDRIPESRARGAYRLSKVRLARTKHDDRRFDLGVTHRLFDGEHCTVLSVSDSGAPGGSTEFLERLSRFTSLARLAPAGIVELAADWTCLYANEMWNRLSRLSARESAGFGWMAAIHSEELDEVIAEMREALSRRNLFQREVRLKPPNGPISWVRINMTALRGADGRTTGYLLVASDVTENHLMLERLHDLAHKDALTGLWNRMAWLETLDERMKSVDRPGQLGVLYIDLDGFKAVNDTVGHDHGDALLKAVAERLLAAVRPQDMLARLGGDEFAVVLPDLADAEAAAAVAQRIVRTVGQPFTILEKELSVGASVGIALADSLEVDRATLVKRADTALYAAKHAGRSRYVFHTEEQDRAQRERSEITVALRQAVDTMAFSLHYQPQIDFATDRIVGFEALLRIAPGIVPAGVDTETLVHILESTGLIGVVGSWALDAACRQLALWRDSHALDPAVTMSVNVSGRQLGQGNFVEDVARVLDRSGLSPASLILEITESVLVDTRDSDIVDRLKTLGVRIALDDFGKGYSSLAYLGRLPLDHLKIDRSFVESLTTSDEARKIVRCIVSLARSLGMRVTAEGIEDAGTLEFLLEEGCHDWQGYLFSRPVPVEEIDTLLALEQHRWPPAADDAAHEASPVEASNEPTRRAPRFASRA